MFDEAEASVVGALVLGGDAADQHHQLPQLLGQAAALLRPRQLLTDGRQQLPQLHTHRQTGKPETDS